MGLRLMVTSCFSLRHMEQKLITAPSLDLRANNLSDQGHTPGIWGKGHSFRLTENKAKVSESYTDCLAISTSLLTSF